MASETRSAQYEILDRSVAVEWIATDFSNQIAGLPEDTRIPLLDAGVIFSRPDPNEQGVIYVTDKMSDDM